MAAAKHFRQAKRENIRARILIDGVAGAGKTYTSLLIAMAIAGEKGRIGAIDSKNGQILRYADEFRFGYYDIIAPYHPEKFVGAIEQAANQNIDVLILDSASPEWDGDGGCLELAKGGPGLDDWKGVSPRHHRFVSAIEQFPGHVIVTCETKDAWEFPKNDRGRIQPVRIGTDIVQRPRFAFMFDLWLRMQQPDNTAFVEKSVLRDWLPTGTEIKPDLQTGEDILSWINGEEFPYEDDDSTDEHDAQTFTPAVADQSDVTADTAGDDSGDPFNEWGEQPDELPPVTPPQRPTAARTAAPPARAATGATKPVAAPVLPVTSSGTPCAGKDCDQTVYPHVIEKIGGNDFDGATLIKMSMERHNKVLCPKCYVAAGRTRAGAAPKRAASA